MWCGSDPVQRRHDRPCGYCEPVLQARPLAWASVLGLRLVGFEPIVFGLIVRDLMVA
jgi:hypothetical protein